MAVSRLCIVGLGLMGGGIGLAARKKGAAHRVVGVTAREATLQKALSIGAIDEGTLDPTEGVAEADLVLLAVPGRLVEEITHKILPNCREDAVITDVDSTKVTVVDGIEDEIAAINSKVRFVGSHPLAGSEKSGIDAAPLLNLENAWCILTPKNNTDPDAVRMVTDFWKALGMRTRRKTPEEHDEILARSSHLSHILSAALLAHQNKQSMEFSGTGLKDMSRLAAGNPNLWTNICYRNSHQISRALKECAKDLTHLSETLEILANPEAPAAEAAHERLFRFLADGAQRREEYLKIQEKSSTEEDEEE